jgi:hypothetical protein
LGNALPAHQDIFLDHFQEPYYSGERKFNDQNTGNLIATNGKPTKNPLNSPPIFLMF